MPAKQFRVLDDSSLEVSALSPKLPEKSMLVKYLTNPQLALQATRDLVKAAETPLTAAGSKPLELGLSFRTTAELGVIQEELAISASARASLNVYAKPGQAVGGVNLFGPDMAVGSGEAWLGFAVDLGIRAGLTRQTGDLTFGFTGGTSMRLEHLRSFPTGSAEPTLGSAVSTLLQGLTLPADLEDLDAMPVGSITALSGAGSFAIAGSFNLLTAVNPLASVNLPVSAGTLGVKTGAKVAFTLSGEVKGEFQVRVHKIGPRRIQLGVYRKKGTALSVGVNASAGVSVPLRGKDLLERVVKAISTDPTKDMEILEQAGLNEEQLQAVQAAVTESVSRSVKASLEGSLSTVSADEAAFLYEADLDALDDAGREAVHNALDGNFSGLTHLEAEMPGHGLQCVRSVMGHYREKGFRLKINLFGIVNFLSIGKLIREGQFLYEPLTGQLNITDSVTAKRLSVASRPFAADSAALHRALYDSLFVTAAYRATRCMAEMDLRSGHSYFEQRDKITRNWVSDNLDPMVAVGIASPQTKTAFLRRGPFAGPGAFHMESSFSSESCEALFLDSKRRPRKAAEYYEVGRRALLSLVLKGDENDFRRIPFEDDATWKKLLKIGNPASGEFVNALPDKLRPRAAVIGADYTLIALWGDSMAQAAEALVEVRDFLAEADPATLPGSNEFKKRRANMEKKLASIVSRSKPQFGDPWGLVALALAAERTPPEITASLICGQSALHTGTEMLNS